MTLELLFWILMLFWLLFDSWSLYRVAPTNYQGIGGNVLLFVLMGILGFKVFGHIIQG